MKESKQLYYLGLNTNKTFWQNAPKDQEAYESIEQACDYLDNVLYENSCFVALNHKTNLRYRNFDLYTYESTLKDIKHALRIIKEYEHLKYFDHAIIEYN
jgi:hypothetical protein